jgi:hypothetical protein
MNSMEEILTNEGPGKLMIIGIIISSDLVFGDRGPEYSHRKEATFELMILSTLYLLQKFEQEKPEYYLDFEKNLYQEIYLFAKDEGILEIIPHNIEEFINSRFILYDNEFSKEYPEQIKIPAHTTYNLLVKPLQIESGICEDLFKTTALLARLNNYYESLNKMFKLMIEKKYSKN